MKQIMILVTLGHTQKGRKIEANDKSHQNRKDMRIWKIYQEEEYGYS